MALGIKPLNDRLIVSREQKEEMTAGGIVLPESAKEKPIKGRVMAVGQGRRLDNGEIIPLQVKEGQTVMFGKYAGTEIKLDGQEYVVLREDDVIGIVE
jgi:chaperonin GroES